MSDYVDPAERPLPPTALRRLVSWQLSQAGARSHQLVAGKLAAEGLRKHHHAVLAALLEFGGMTQAELGRRLGVDRSDMVAIINALEAEHLVRRNPDPEDRRRNIVVATSETARVLARTDVLVDEANAELLAELSGAEREQLYDLLVRITRMPAR
ncbi:DNA-binding MarR family transcriptional regulator [Prauserella shujinwangii]|uniref:DNA-binding MarR family transcriptional regulator n=1 Tax=Prauserella shujinwangii TaxID=1453103 RepID=A0A2T0LPF5_9PSEU|nr:MarR family winged helix-turn-helix transcriptional regulator [Prauserella shujinwangii]PRX45141.1 DNA-binding MarR family transcriptional regulator [Prauserella shujinwangii]